MPPEPPTRTRLTEFTRSIEAFRCASYSPGLQSRKALIRKHLGSSTTASHRKYGNARSHSAHDNGISLPYCPKRTVRGEYPPIYIPVCATRLVTRGGLPRLTSRVAHTGM